jgi:hypothetical protein
MSGNGLEDVYVVNPAQLRPSTADEVAALEAELGVRMPAGYAEYVQRLGDGALGHFVRVYPPTRLATLSGEWRERVQEYWFWGTAAAGVEPQSLQQGGVAIADTFDGDEVCFLPEDPDALFVLPRNDDDVVPVGPGLLSALQWLLDGNLNPWVEGWSFETSTNRVEVRQDVTSFGALDVAAQALADLGEHAHVVELDDRQTFFLPAIGGRLSLYQPEDEPLAMDLTYDADADPVAVARPLAVLGVRGSSAPYE